jgi:hypothetical protein
MRADHPLYPLISMQLQLREVEAPTEEHAPSRHPLARPAAPPQFPLHEPRPQHSQPPPQPQLLPLFARVHGRLSIVGSASELEDQTSDLGRREQAVRLNLAQGLQEERVENWLS